MVKIIDIIIIICIGWMVIQNFHNFYLQADNTASCLPKIPIKITCSFSWTMRADKRKKLMAWFMVLTMVLVVFVVAAAFIAGL